ncbi:hypothetical protein AVEN_13550-1 [Araneus ventricosus]|uniref:Uncharacterized protein n=1 Tax=Araneus ventricosus TaxID=182803 RepID=A0A4Y2D5R3_ARAVE|nr:hypothetical protein AVEN_13550-1 [Araneus ventricosus]
MLYVTHIKIGFFGQTAEGRDKAFKRNFEPRSDEEDDTDQEFTLQTSTPHQQKDVWPTTSDLTCTISIEYMGILECNRVLYFEQSGTETETTSLPRPQLKKSHKYFQPSRENSTKKIQSTKTTTSCTKETLFINSYQNKSMFFLKYQCGNNGPHNRIAEYTAVRF